MTVSLFIEGALTKRKDFASQFPFNHLNTYKYLTVYATSENTSGIYASIAMIFIFQGFYSFGVSPLIALYPQEVSYYKIRAAGAATCRASSVAMAFIFSFAMSYAMEDLGWKFYLVNASWDVVFCAIIYFTWVETKGIPLEEITAKFEGPSVLEGTEGSLKFTTSGGPRDPDEKAPAKVEAGAL